MKKLIHILLTSVLLIVLLSSILLAIYESDGERSQQQIQRQKEIEMRDDVTERYLPKELTVEDVKISDDAKFIQIFVRDDYDDVNIHNLYSFLTNKKKQNQSANFDIDTYQEGYKYADDQIVIIIETKIGEIWT